MLQEDNKNLIAAMDEMFKLMHHELNMRNIRKIKLQPFASLRGMRLWRKREVQMGRDIDEKTDKRATAQ